MYCTYNCEILLRLDGLVTDVLELNGSYQLDFNCLLDTPFRDFPTSYTTRKSHSHFISNVKIDRIFLYFSDVLYLLEKIQIFKTFSGSELETSAYKK